MNIFKKKDKDGEEGTAEGAPDTQEVSGGSGSGASEEPEVGTLKKGDYMVHVYIQEARQLKSPEGEATIDPMIEVQCRNSKKYTKALDDIGTTGISSWHEHIFYEFQNMEAEDAEGTKININVLNKKMLKDSLIGNISFDLSYIYFQKDHAMQHQWVALQNPNSKDFTEVFGYLKLSASVIATGDKQVQLNEDTGPDATDSQMIIMPPSIKK